MRAESPRLLLDENVPVPVTGWLQEQKPDWTVEHTSDVGLNGRPDIDVFRWAQDRGAIVVTFDDDFADLRTFSEGHFGVIRLRIWPTTIEETQAALTRLFESTDISELQGALTIISQSKIRIRSIGKE